MKLAAQLRGIFVVKVNDLAQTSIAKNLYSAKWTAVSSCTERTSDVVLLTISSFEGTLKSFRATAKATGTDYRVTDVLLSMPSNLIWHSSICSLEMTLSVLQDQVSGSRSDVKFWLITSGAHLQFVDCHAPNFTLFGTAARH